MRKLAIKDFLDQVRLSITDGEITKEKKDEVLTQLTCSKKCTVTDYHVTIDGVYVHFVRVSKLYSSGKEISRRINYDTGAFLTRIQKRRLACGEYVLHAEWVYHPGDSVEIGEPL